jgi:predicted transcriptional regulator
MAFLYTKDKQVEKEIRETTPLSIVTNIIKYLRLTITKEVKELYDRHFKSLKKNLKKISEDGEISHAHGLAGTIQ